MQAISDTINQLHLGKSTTFEGLTAFPLFGDSAFEADYLTLDEALEQEQARVLEVNEDGDASCKVIRDRPRFHYWLDQRVKRGLSLIYKSFIWRRG
jgi:hypothetical protein